MGSDSEVGVIDQGLWERVSAAFPAVNAAIDRHVEEGRRIPRASVPVMETFDDSGWPHVQFPVMPGDGAPPDYSRLFGLTAWDFTPYGYRDIPELAAVIDYVTGRADLVKRLDVIPELAQVLAETAMWFVTLQAARQGGGRPERLPALRAAEIMGRVLPGSYRPGSQAGRDTGR